jgi:hypothetical protein
MFMCFVKRSSVTNLDLFWKQSFLIHPSLIFESKASRMPMHTLVETFFVKASLRWKYFARVKRTSLLFQQINYGRKEKVL